MNIELTHKDKMALANIKKDYWDNYTAIAVEECELLERLVKLFAIPDVRVFVCPECENPYMHLYKDGGGHCEDCGYSFRANEP